VTIQLNTLSLFMFWIIFLWKWSQCRSKHFGNKS